MLWSWKPAQKGRVMTLFDRSAGHEPPICTLGTHKLEMHAFWGGGEHRDPSTSTLLLASPAPSLVRGPALTLPFLCRCSGGIVSISPRPGAQDSGRARCFSHSQVHHPRAIKLLPLSSSPHVFFSSCRSLARWFARALRRPTCLGRGPRRAACLAAGCALPHARARACDRGRSILCSPLLDVQQQPTPGAVALAPLGALRRRTRAACPRTMWHVCMWSMMDRPVSCGSAQDVPAQRAAGAARQCMYQSLYT